MNQKELILRALTEYSFVTAKELSMYIKRTYKQDVSTMAIAGALKAYQKEGKVAASNCGIGTHYWAIK